MDELKQLFNEQVFSTERAQRIFEEFIRTKQQLEAQKIKNTIVMFGSARIKPDDSNPLSRTYYEAARTLAHRLAEWSQKTFEARAPEERYYIATGGGGGIMEAANRGAAEAGARTMGFNILLPFEQSANQYIPPELVYNFHYFFIRKFYFAFLAKAFVIFPGGFGTFDELFEILTLAQTNKMQKLPPFVIFGKSFFKKVLNIEMLLEHGLISKEDENLFFLTDDVDEAFTHITENISRSLHFVD